MAYWTALSDVIEPWRMVRDKEMRPSEARIEYIVAHSVAFYALGAAGAKVLGIGGPADWGVRDFEQLKGLHDIDWLKTNAAWQGIVMLGSSVVTRHQTRQALTRRICHLIDPERFEDAPRVLGD